MTEFRSEFLHILQQRGFVQDITHPQPLDQRLQDGSIPAYIGFDCTASSLHVGSLLPIMMLRWLQKTGHKPLIVLGGGTTRIGDPSGRDSSRQLLSPQDIQNNMAGIRQVFERFLSFEGSNAAVMIDNAEWLDGLNYIEFMRDYGRHFSVNRMLGFDSVRLRLERQQPLTFLEFNYILLQSYDFVELYRRYGCVLQMGGSDQWGNIVSGIELGRKLDNADLYGLTTPLLTTASGAKMGKTASGAVWLNEQQLSAWEYWQYWRNSDDADVGRFLRLFTQLPLDEIARLEVLQGQELNEAKKILACHATAMLHGQEAADQCLATAEKNFGASSANDMAGLPEYELNLSDMPEGVGLLDVLVASGMTTTKSEARRLVRERGVRLDDVVCTDERFRFLSDTAPNTMRLSIGRKRHICLCII